MFLLETSTFRQLNTLPIERPKNRSFAPKLLSLPPHGCTLPSFKIVTLDRNEYLFCSGMKIPLKDLLDPFKQWRFRHYDKNNNPYRHPYPLAVDQKHRSFYFIKDKMLHSAPLDHPLEEQSYVNFKKSIQYSPAIDRNGILYFSSAAKDGKATLYAIDPQNPLYPLWSYTFDFCCSTSTPIIDKNGIIYVVSLSWGPGGLSISSSSPEPPPSDFSNLFAFDPKTIDQENPQPCWSYRSECNFLDTLLMTISSDQKLYIYI